MASQRKFDFYVLHYAPNALREDRVGIGVLLVEQEGDFVDLKFVTDWRRVQCLDPNADLELLRDLENDLRTQLRKQDRQSFMRKLSESFSGTLQLSPSRPCETDQPEKQIKMLTEQYLEAPRPAEQRERSKRLRIRDGIADEFKNRGVYDMINRDLPVVSYTRTGDPFKFDFGYRVGKTIKLFQAVAMTSDIRDALLLAGRYPTIATGIRNVTDAVPVLTAVTETGVDSNNEQIGFAMAMMKDASIRVANLYEMSMLAEQARTDLLPSGITN